MEAGFTDDVREGLLPEGDIYLLQGNLVGPLGRRSLNGD